MVEGRLSSYFEDIAYKRLSAVEADPHTSNQHEFNGVGTLRRMFGDARKSFDTRFIFLGDNESDVFSSEGFLTWYDAREDHPTRTEYRLYFQANPVSSSASVGDLLIIARESNGNILCLVVKGNTTFENQLLWLFGLRDQTCGFSVNSISDENDRYLDFAARYILEELGIEVQNTDESWLDRILMTFGHEFPGTSDFSIFARSTLPEVNSLDNPDLAFMQWMDQEEMLFRTLEKHIVQIKLEEGFSEVDEFISYSLSVQNRRKSRAGWAMEHHLAQVFIDHEINFSHGMITENNARPDFIFPHIRNYHDDNFPKKYLTMLGAKTSCKDRWRQVLSEAQRIPNKHLFTLEPGVSVNQTREMQANNLQLVIPKQLFRTYDPKQIEWLLNLSDFIGIIKQRQSWIYD